MDDDVDRAGELRRDGWQRPRRRRLHDQRLESVEDVEGAVGVTRRPRPVVAGVQRLDEGEHLGAAHLADDQAVGTQPQRGAHELLERDRRWAVDGGRAGLEPEEVNGGRQQLGGVLDRDDPLARSATRPSSGVEQRRLARRRGAADDHVAPRRSTSWPTSAVTAWRAEGVERRVNGRGSGARRGRRHRWRPAGRPRRPASRRAAERRRPATSGRGGDRAAPGCARRRRRGRRRRCRRPGAARRRARPRCRRGR